MIGTFIRCFLIVGLTTTLVLVFCDTEQGQRLLGKAGLYLDQHGIPNDVARAEKQAQAAPAAPQRQQLVQLPSSVPHSSHYEPAVLIPVHRASNAMTCLGKS